MFITKLFKRKKKEEIEENPFRPYDEVLLINGIEHQNIGGCKALIEKEVTADIIIDKAEIENNIAALNFIKRREDLFIKNGFFYMPTRKSKRLKYYYVKIWKENKTLNGIWLGYFIASDEIEKYIYVKPKDRKEEK